MTRGGPPTASLADAREGPLLSGIDRAAFAVALTLEMRRALVAVGITGAQSLSRALGACPADSRSRLYWEARISLVRRRRDLEAFDRVFAAVFDHVTLELDPNARRRPLSSAPGDELTPVGGSASAEQHGGGLPWATLPAVVGVSSDAGAGPTIPERLPSGLESVADVPFEELDANHLLLLDDWLASALASWPRRRTRRLVDHRSGHQVALRPTLAKARRTGWEPVELVRQRPVHAPRKIVMLCDVSRSMQAHSAAYLHLMRALSIAVDAEVFAFATALTRLTAVLSHRSPAAAVDLATAKVADRFGGTRIAANIRSLLRSRHASATRGAVIVVASDGWDSGDPAELASAMARLARRAYRIIWLNPRAAAPGYEPLVGAMAAALPFCDAFLAADDIHGLAEVVAEIGGSRFGLSSTRSRAPTGGNVRR